jgi:hypothetical protein
MRQLQMNGVGGWFLQSRDELALMYRNSDLAEAESTSVNEGQKAPSFGEGQPSPRRCGAAESRTSPPCPTFCRRKGLCNNPQTGCGGIYSAPS